jgi:hypothetical protein
MRQLRSILLATTFAFASACTSGGGGPADTAPRPDRNVIAQEEIDASKANDAYAVVRILRPAWLLPKTVGSGPQAVQLYVEGSRASSLSALQDYNVSQVREIRFLNGEDATTRFGTGNGAGAILLLLKR